MPKPSILMLSPLIGMAALVVSCTERTAPADGDPPYSFGFTNGPASPGNSGLFRFRDTWIDAVFDFNVGLLSIIGLQNTVADLCNDLGEFDLMDFQIKPHELGERNSVIVNRQASVQVLAIPAVSQGDFCADFAGAPVLYSGTGSFLRTDNNFTPTGSEGGRANSFGFTSQGVLTDLVNGGQVHYVGTVRLVISPNNEFKEVVSRITIR
jgi:hypothetical protein